MQISFVSVKPITNICLYLQYSLLPTMFISQIRIEAQDGDSPPKTAMEIVTVTVNRNLNAPAFVTPGINQEYQVRIKVLETISFQTILYTSVLVFLPKPPFCLIVSFTDFFPHKMSIGGGNKH